MTVQQTTTSVQRLRRNRRTTTSIIPECDIRTEWRTDGQNCYKILRTA